MDYMVNRRVIIENNAKAKQAIYDELRTKSYDRNKKDIELTEGQWVLWNINAHFVGNKRKLGPKWIGPYEITKIWNNRQSFTIRVISDKLSEYQDYNKNPMNSVKVPHYKRIFASFKHKKHSTNDEEQLFEFNVPRSQIKPYFKRYEQHFDSIQSPIEFAKVSIKKEIAKSIQQIHDVKAMSNPSKDAQNLRLHHEQQLSFNYLSMLNLSDIQIQWNMK